MKHHIDKSVSLFVAFMILAVVFMIAVDSSITGNLIKPQNACHEESYQCNGNRLQYCENNNWVNRETCNCKNNACLVNDKCTENSFRCYNGYSQKCVNSKWQNFEKCWSSCVKGVCKL